MDEARRAALDARELLARPVSRQKRRSPTRPHGFAPKPPRRARASIVTLTSWPPPSSSGCLATAHPRGPVHNPAFGVPDPLFVKLGAIPRPALARGRSRVGCALAGAPFRRAGAEHRVADASAAQASPRTTRRFRTGGRRGAHGRGTTRRERLGVRGQTVQLRRAHGRAGLFSPHPIVATWPIAAPDPNGSGHGRHDEGGRRTADHRDRCEVEAVAGRARHVAGAGAAGDRGEQTRIEQAAVAERERLLEQTRREIDLQLRAARRELVRTPQTSPCRSRGSGSDAHDQRGPAPAGRPLSRTGDDA